MSNLSKKDTHNSETYSVASTIKSKSSFFSKLKSSSKEKKKDGSKKNNSEYSSPSIRTTAEYLAYKS